MKRQPTIGALTLLTRVVERCPDASALHAALTRGGRDEDTLLLETLDVDTRQAQQSFVVSRAALRMEGRGTSVVVTPLTEGGRVALSALRAGFATLGETRDDGDALHLTCPLPSREGSERERLMSPSPLDALRMMVGGWSHAPCPVKPAVMAAGIFAYDLIDVFEDLPAPLADPQGFPDLRFWLPEELLVLDPVGGRTTALILVFDGPEQAQREADARGHPEALARVIEERVEVSDDAPLRAPARGEEVEASCEIEQDDAAYEAVVSRLKEHIAAGDIFQAVPSRTFSAPCPDAFAAYRALRRLEPSPYMFFIRGGGDVLLGASPETCVKVSRDAQADDGSMLVEIRPIAGTAPRGLCADGSVDADLDGRLEAALRLDEKELAEHMMLIDLARNDVARVSVPGSRHVPRILTVDRYAHVMHLVSYVSGTLREELDALHAYAASMNMGTLVGAPKLRAAALLREVEATRRGTYGGGVGYLTEDGEMDTAIIIRSASVRDGVARVRAGAGVVYDSDPCSEALETRRKARGVLRALITAATEEGAR